MSIVVAVKKNDRLVMAADSLVTFGDYVRMPADNASTPKVYPLGESIVGLTGWALYDDILLHYLHEQDPPDFTEPRLIFDFFMNLWQVLHEKYSFVNDQSGGKEKPFGDLDSSFLIGNRAGIFHVSPNMCVTKLDRYYAIGSGSDYAIGVVHALYGSELDAEAIARSAVEAAIVHDVSCGGEIVALTVE